MEGTSLASATIIDKDHGSTVKCMFNPKEYTFSKQNSWKANDTKGTNLGQVEFSSGQPTTLQMQLFFDTYANVKNDAIGGVPKDVRKVYTGAIWKMMKVDKSLSDAKNKKGRPPIVIFQWGSTWTFKAAITSVRERFTLFTAEGVPVRSTLDVTFQQIQDEDDYPGTNPTSGGVGGERVWTVSEGDTLAWIAYKIYGDPSRWRLIADANRLTKVRQLTPGITLEIPNA
jgi:nucleoid-associated protein YgaU